MKLKAFYFKETELARLLGPSEDAAQAIWVPQDRTAMFRKLPFKTKGVPEHPRRCIFTVEEWLMKKPEFSRFEEATYGVDYI